MPSNEFRTLKRKEQEGREEKRERETGRGKKDQTELKVIRMKLFQILELFL